MEGRKSARWLWVLAAALAVVAGVPGAASARTNGTLAVSHGYDTPPIARVDVLPFKPAETSPTQLSGSREESAPLSVEARGTSRTPVAGFVATEAVAGPGAWETASESISERAAAFQAEVTGAAPGSVYRVGGVHFDGFANGTLLEAKDPGYATFVRGTEVRLTVDEDSFVGSGLGLFAAVLDQFFLRYFGPRGCLLFCKSVHRD